MTTVISTRNLTKRYGRLVAVDDVSFEVRQGEVFGFLGPNGSGKTTTIRMLLGLVFASSGHVELLGAAMPHSAPEVLRRVGAVVDGPGFYPHLSGRLNLALFDAANADGSRRSRKRRIEAALERVGLDSIDKRPVRAYSTGMSQRLALAGALLRHPELLILDEPTNGLDPHGIHEMRTLIAQLAAEGTTVFLSSHQLNEVELICTRAAMMASGRLVTVDTVARLLAPTGRLLIDTPDTDSALKILTADGLAATVDDKGTGIVVNANGRASHLVNELLVRSAIRVRELNVERRTLEDAYLDLTKGADDAGR